MTEPRRFAAVRSLQCNTSTVKFNLEPAVADQLGDEREMNL